MAISLAKSSRGGNGGRRGRRARAKLMSEINVTPMVDVMLVLLIVFMVAAPLLTVGVPIDLPKTEAKSLNTEQKPVTVSVTPSGEVYIGDRQIALAALIDAVDTETAGNSEERIYVRGDATADYGTVMQVMGVLSGAGYSRIGLITEPVQGQ
ncbi:MAG: protein TolR [Alphaproteobacteria bacterium]|nr:protein TolR [Alphaproteobacteria bacterium]